MKLLYTERAKNDIDSAFAWYENQRRGLGFDYLDCVEIAVKSILDNPEIYQIIYSNIRACMIRRFPFSVFYSTEGEGVIVHAVFDNRQDPENRP